MPSREPLTRLTPLPQAHLDAAQRLACLRLIRSRIWQARISTGTHESSDLIQFPRELLDALIHGLASAA